ncbi:MAG: SOS response-associated peptidase, partial [Deltaproteobacteria bacterium]|nr:SOS response-associated peptidase [Deltaproteobacteria bacterium]
VSPGQRIPAVVRRGGHNELALFQWGLIPAWCKDPSIGAKLFNARAETVAEKPSFKNAFVNRRCLIPADGFFEWRKEGNKKIPYSFFLKSGQSMGLAGLYETWMAPDKKPVHTCTIITTRPNAIVEPIHDRMPVIIPVVARELWLNPHVKDTARLIDLLQPYPASEMAYRPADP